MAFNIRVEPSKLVFFENRNEKISQFIGAEFAFSKFREPVDQKAVEQLGGD